MTRDLFNPDAPHSVVQKATGMKPRRKPTQPRGYAAPPGTGPEGETCKTCKHIYRYRSAKTYLKCGLNRSNWTHGPGSDIRAGSPACSKWEAEPETAV